MILSAPGQIIDKVLHEPLAKVRQIISMDFTYK